jgi:hypothetical protein
VIAKALRTIGVATAILLACALLAAGVFALYARGGVSGLLARPLPDAAEPEIGVDYRAQVDCQHQIYVGSSDTEIGPVELKGITGPVHLLAARRAE